MYPIASRILCVLAFSLTMSPAAQAQSMPAADLLRLVPDLQVDMVDSSCCGMAGAFGFEAGHFDVSMRMAELALLPAVRGAGAETVIVADGTSCRHQIRDGSARHALHAARLLEMALHSPS